MILVSTTISGNCESKIAEALKSVVDYVDFCILVDTGITDKTIEVAKEIAGDKLVVRSFPWCNSFGAARNFALETAYDINADWCITVDTDERIHVDGAELRELLEHTKSGVLMLSCSDGSYSKDRVFNTRTNLRWTGATHEYFPSHKCGRENLRGNFSELDKTVEQSRNKFLRDLEILKRSTADNPKESRWWFYLGETYKHLDRNADAINAYAKCAGLKGWSEESAVACFRAAECSVILKKYDDAVEFCASGMQRDPGFSELPWLASVASYRAGRLEQAVHWARMSVAIGPTERIMFRDKVGTTFGPYDVLRFALPEGPEKVSAEKQYQSFAAT